jgi:mannose-1-phosphate guanylyltransferase / mannose-6-phosphate isomerase
MRKVYPVLLCGGSGTRLWPLSRKSYPKQFVPLVGDKTLFQQTAHRLTGQDAGMAFQRPVILTHADFRFIVTEQLAALGIDPLAVMIEPAGRNTAPSVLAAALYLEQTDPDALILVAPADHVLPDTAAFHAAVAQGVKAADQGRLVTFGITPDRPETGYGYLQLAARPDGSGAAIALTGFKEKPDLDGARALLEQGDCLWNAGIFLFRARDMIAAFAAHAPDLVAPTRAAVTGARPDLGLLRLDPDAWGQLRDISLDHAVMEAADNLSVVPYDGVWSDLGGWDAVWREMGPDADGVALGGNATAIDCTETLLRSEADGLQIVGIGLTHIVAVAMPDAVLVADMRRAQDVKRVVDVLRAKGAAQAETFPRDHRPWGWFESLAIGARFQVKRIMVHPGAALSLQSHVHRSEHWIVVQGTALVTVDDTVTLVTENQSVYVPLGAIHRLENPGKLPMMMIEVQTGAYVGEDDIIRYQDIYGRQAEAWGP